MNTNNTSYAYDKIPNNDDEYSQKLKEFFYIYQEIQDICGEVNGCGSYFHNAVSKDYDPSTYQKQLSLYNLAKNATNCLEIGVFNCSSALIMLIANPQLKITGIDICEYNFVETAVKIINKYFVNSYTLLNGTSCDLIPTLTSGTKYDLIHIDADHSFPAVSFEIQNLINYSTADTILVFDDTDNIGVSSAIKFHSEILDHIYTSQHIYSHSVYKYKPHIYNIVNDSITKIDTNNSNPTLVTMLYDLKKQDGNNRRSINDYIAHADFSLSLPYNMVIYTESDLFWTVWNCRKKYNLLDRTVIIVKPYNELPCYKYLDLVKLLHEVKPIKYLNKEKDTANYMVIQWSKFTFLNDVIKNNPFNATHVMWLDCGIGYRINKDKYLSAFSNLPDYKIKVALFEILNFNDISNINHYDVNRRIIDGGYFGGNIHSLKIFISYFDSELLNALAHSKAPHEDTIITRVIVQHPELFTFSFCQHQTVLNNFNYPTVDLDNCITTLIPNARNMISHNRKSAHIGLICAELIYNSWNLKKITLDMQLFEKLLEEYFILAFYLKGPNSCLPITDTYKEMLLESDDFMNAYESHKDRINSNFSHVGVNM